MNRTRANIMIVDDVQSVASLMGQLLEGRGHRAIVMTDSRSALQYFEDYGEDVDIVITDQAMPGMSGVELSRQMLALRPALPIVLMSGFSADVDEDSAKRMGISMYAIKPLDFDVFFDQVDELLRAAGHK